MKAKKMSRAERKKRAVQAKESMNILRAMVVGLTDAAAASGHSDYETMLSILKHAGEKLSLERRMNFLLRVWATWEMRPFFRRIRTLFRRQHNFQGQAAQMHDYIFENALKSLRPKYKKVDTLAEKNRIMQKVMQELLITVLGSAMHGRPIMQQQVARRTQMR